MVWTTVLIVAAGGCRRSEPERSGESAAMPAASSSPEPKNAESAAPEPAELPDGYVSARVLRVAATDRSSVVVLQSEKDGRVVPIFVGGTEALSIGLRHESRRYPRPLTHDLLDSLVDELGGDLVKVHVDSLQRNVFIGRVYMRQESRVFDVDARPSDAIALAIGNRVPIFVASDVVNAAGMRLEDITKEPRDDPMVPPSKRPEEPTML